MTVYFEWHKHNDFICWYTTITRWDGEELPLGLNQVTFVVDEHHISPRKHPHSGKQFIPMAPSTKARLFKEASRLKGPLRIFNEVSEAAGGVLDCE